MTDLTAARLIELAEAKLADAQLLASGGRLANAFYLAGYAVELMLKAVVVSQFKAQTLPDRTLVDRLYSHKLDQLTSLAGLAGEAKRRSDTDPTFAAMWQTALGWSENARYADRGGEAESLLRAIEDPEHGVMAWLRTRL